MAEWGDLLSKLKYTKMERIETLINRNFTYRRTVMKKMKFGQIIMFLIWLAIGAAGGYLLASYINEHDYSFLQLLYSFVWLMVGYFIGIIIHESGHLVAGLKSKYEFVSFRIGSMTWIKED